MVVAIMLLLAIALGLKAWEERQSADAALLAALQGEARAIAGRIEGRAETAETAIRLITSGATSRSAIAAATPGVDAVVSLTDAMKAPNGSRLRAAADAGSQLASAGQRVGISEQGDIVLVTEADSGAKMIALAPAGTWIPPVMDGRQIVLDSGSQSFSSGDPSLTPLYLPLAAGASAFARGEGLSRAATACAGVSGGGLLACAVVPSPLLTVDDLVRLLIFGLLISAPILAIVGLMNHLSAEQSRELAAAARENDSEHIVSAVMRGSLSGYWEWTPHLMALDLSEAACELFGMSGSGELSIATLVQQVHSEDRQRFGDAIKRSRTIGWIQISVRTVAATPRWIEMRGATTETAKGPRFGGIVLDITDRKQSEERTRAAERRLRNAIEGFNGPFALWDNRKRLLYWNRAFAFDFGLEDTLRPGMAHDTMIIARAGAVLSERQSADDEHTNLLCVQNGRWLKMVERPTPDGGLITVGVDVTENVRNEDELKRQKDRMRKAVLDLERSEGRAGELARKYSEEKTRAEYAASSKSAFLANMSHELRTPLNAINGFSEILAHELYGPLGDARYKGYAADILTSGQHLLDMINDILDMAKIEAGKMTINPQPIDPVDPVDAAVRMIRRKAGDKDIELVLDAQPGLPEIDADHRAIRQMVLNLVSNAIKFTDAGGTITVSVQQQGPEIRVAVTDTGIGIPAEDLPRLAQPFEQVSGSRDRNYEGTGLGLALTKSFAEMHGGRMSISSIQGEGTTVAFTLPIDGASSVADAFPSRDVA